MSFSNINGSQDAVLDQVVEQQIRQQLSSDLIVLYMKGTPTFPMCGFSSQLVGVLQELGVEFTSFNVLEDEAVRQGLKLYSQWPTFPQLYVQGTLIGGCDIVVDMHEKGELAVLIQQAMQHTSESSAQEGHESINADASEDKG